MKLSTILMACIAVYFAAIVIEFVLTRKYKRFLLETVVMVLAVSLALLVNNASTGRLAFGVDTSPLWTVGIMFIATIFGILAKYFFYLQQGRFSWLDCLKPLTITPLILLPLMGSIQGTGRLNDMQLVSFAFMAFQNGFFWEVVLGKAKPKTKE